MSKNYIEENQETPIYNIQEADAAQREYCNENDYPFFRSFRWSVLEV